MYVNTSLGFPLIPLPIKEAVSVKPELTLSCLKFPLIPLPIKEAVGQETSKGASTAPSFH